MNPVTVLTIILIILAGFLFLQAIYDLFYKRQHEHLASKKLLWLIALFLFPILMPILYFQIQSRNSRSLRKNEFRRG